jgi:hypothetical protein
MKRYASRIIKHEIEEQINQATDIPTRKFLLGLRSKKLIQFFLVLIHAMSSHHRSHTRIHVSAQSGIRRRRNKPEGKKRKQGIDDEIGLL